MMSCKIFCRTRDKFPLLFRANPGQTRSARGRYIKEIRIRTSVEKLFAWHERKGAILRLTPPWVPLKMIARSNDGIQKGTRVSFKVSPFKIPILWESEHIEYQKNRFFKDRQIKGPFTRWEHSHLFKSDGGQHSIIKDKLEFQLPFGILSRPFYGWAMKELDRLFAYRHRVLKYDIENDMGLPGKKKKILISGAGGTIGSALVPFLQTMGHDVIQLVRKRGTLLKDELFWDPYKGILDIEQAGKIDAVINLNGVNITDGRWTKKQKKLIFDSRIIPTNLLAEKAARLDPVPDVFVSASAIGFYGAGNDKILTEADSMGSCFLSRVCRHWEKASTDTLERTEIRCVNLRTGVVLTPGGGALAKMLPAFRMGLGAQISHGRQYMSWISIEDVLSGLLYILNHDKIDGPVNMTAPCPVTNKEFSQTLAGVFSKKLLFTVPEFMAKILWGAMGEETFLASVRVMPEKLLNNGFNFQHKTLLTALQDLLGR